MPTIPEEVALARHAIDLDDDGHDAVENLVTVETDTSLVVAPDGAGGVGFRAEAGAGVHYEVLMDGASPPGPLESGSGTDWLYVLVPD
jgi:hypothetical protein